MSAMNLRNEMFVNKSLQLKNDNYATKITN